MSEQTDGPLTEDQILALKLEEVIPHRGDWLQARKILGVDLDAGVLVVECPVPSNPGWADEHFPKAPVMPGHLIAEACAQALGLWAWISLEELRTKMAVLRETNVKFVGQTVPPGNKILAVVCGLEVGARGRTVEGEVRAYLNSARDETMVCKGRIKLAIVDPPSVEPPALV